MIPFFMLFAVYDHREIPQLFALPARGWTSLRSIKTMEPGMMVGFMLIMVMEMAAI